jgi:MscS family membrane protein
MIKFLQQEWGTNSLGEYLSVGFVIILVWLCRRLISRYFAGLLFGLLKNSLRKVERPQFTSLFIQPLGRFLLILVSIVALYRLNFPPELNFTIYKFDAKQLLNSVGTLILISSFTALLLRMIDFVATLLEQRAGQATDLSDNQLIVFFKDFFKVLLVINAILLILRFAFGFDIGGLLTGLSIVGAAIALALREGLENLIASFIIFFDKPFHTGDLVKVNAITGTVERIGLRSTRIRTEQKTYVTVPNKQMVDSIMDNLSLRTQRRADLKLELAAQNDPATVQTFITELKKLLQQDTIEQFNVVLSDIRNNTLIIDVDYYTSPLPIAEFNAIRQQVNLRILELVRDLTLKWPIEE